MESRDLDAASAADPDAVERLLHDGILESLTESSRIREARAKKIVSH